MLTGGGLRHPHLRVVRDGAPVARSEYTVTRTVGGRTIDDLIEPGRAIDAFHDGATLVFQALQGHRPSVGRFCAALAEELAHPTQANAYLSPRESRGLAVHYDTHDVFALQIEGTKRWEVYSPVFRDPLGHQHWSDVRPDGAPDAPEPEGEPLLATTLTPGQSVYVPRGFVHRAWTTSDASLHLTVGVHNRTWFHLFRELAEQSGKDARFRATLPAGGDRPAQFRSLVQEWLHGADLDEPARSGAGLGTSRATSAGFHGGRLVDATRALTDSTLLRVRHPRRHLTTWIEGAEVELRTPDRVMRLPGRIAPAVDLILDRRRLTVSDLAPFLDLEGRLVLARRLVVDGVVSIDASEDQAWPA